MSRAVGGGHGRRSPAALAARTAAAALWFELVFFVAGPAAVLSATGAGFRPPGGAAFVVGAGLIALAHAVLLAQIPAFVRTGRGTHAPFDPPTELVRSGLYGRVRNPMYALYTVVVFGEAILFRSAALGLYALAFCALEHAYVVGVEERTLRRRFGDAYAAYCRQVPRWLPSRARRPPTAPPGPG